MGNFPFQAFAGELVSSPNNMEQYPLYTSILEATAGHLSLKYKDGIVCETTVFKRSGVYKVTFVCIG